MAKTKRKELTKDAIDELKKHCTLETSVLLQPDVKAAFQLVLINLEAINMQEFVAHNSRFLEAAIEHEVIRKKANNRNYDASPLYAWLEKITSGEIQITQPKTIRQWLETSYETFLEFVGTWSK